MNKDKLTELATDIRVADWDYLRHTKNIGAWRKGFDQVNSINAEMKKLVLQGNENAVLDLWRDNAPPHISKPDYIHAIETRLGLENLRRPQPVKPEPQKQSNTLTQEQIDALPGRIKRADWFYAYTEDRGVYRAGEAQIKALNWDLNLYAEQDGPAALKVWKENAPGAGVIAPSKILALEKQMAEAARFDVTPKHEGLINAAPPVVATVGKEAPNMGRVVWMKHEGDVIREATHETPKYHRIAEFVGNRVTAQTERIDFVHKGKDVSMFVHRCGWHESLPINHPATAILSAVNRENGRPPRIIHGNAVMVEGLLKSQRRALKAQRDMKEAQKQAFNAAQAKDRSRERERG